MATHDNVAGEASSTARAAAEAGTLHGSFTGLSPSGWILFLFAGLLAGSLACASIQFFYARIKPSPDIMELLGKLGVSAEEQARINAAGESLNRSRSVMSVGLLGVFTGALLSMVAALVHGARRSRFIGLGLGILLGGGFGALGGIAGNLSELYLRDVTESEMLRIIGMHTAYLAVAGIGIGLAVGITRGTRAAILKCVAMAMLAGLFAAAIYSPLAATLFPLESGDEAVPLRFGSRLLWTMLAALCVALLLARSITIKRVPQSSANLTSKS